MPKAILFCFSKSSLHLLLLFNESDCYLSHVKLSGFKKLQHCRNHISYISIVELSVGLLKVYSLILESKIYVWDTRFCCVWKFNYMKMPHRFPRDSISHWNRQNDVLHININIYVWPISFSCGVILCFTVKLLNMICSNYVS